MQTELCQTVWEVQAESCASVPATERPGKGAATCSQPWRWGQ